MGRKLLVTPYYDPHVVGGAEISTQLIAEGLVGGADVLTAGTRDSERELNGVRIIEMRVPLLDGVWKQSLDGGRLTIRDKLGFHLMPHFPVPNLVNRYRSFIEEGGYDTVLVNSNEDIMARASLWKAAYDSGTRLVLALRDPLLIERPPLHGLTWNTAYRALVRRQLRWVDSFVAPSQYMLDLYAKYKMSCDSSCVIPNAVASTNVPKVSFGEKHGVLYVGTLSENKGVETLLSASTLLRCGEELALIGRGPLMEKCRTSGVECMGWLPHDEAIAKMAQAKVVVLPSEWPEAFGRTLIEAVDAGTLVVGSDAGAIPEVLNDDWRYLFAAGNIYGLAERIDRICSLDEEGYASELMGLRHQFERYSLESYVKAWKGLLDDG